MIGLGTVSSRLAAAVLVSAALLLSACERATSIEQIAFPGARGSAQPRLVQGAAGISVLSWLEPDGDEHALRYARFEAGTFGGVQEVVRSDSMFVNWADFPSVTPITDELWFAHWLKRQAESFGAYDIATLISTDGGRHWIAAEPMNEDTTEAEHGFVSVFDWNDEIAAFWLDGRELANWSFDEPEALLGVSLRLARYAADGSVLARSITDELVCDCCQPDAAVTESGPIVIYRDRTEAEIRDVVVRRYVGDAWSEPLGLGDEGWFIEGCPVNGPVIAAHGRTVAAAWFTGANGHSRVRFARSEDAGASFTAAVDIETRRALGQAAIVLDDDGRALVSWWRRAETGGTDLMLRTVSRDGSLGEPVLIGHEGIEQAVDVPQMIAVGDAYLIAWTTWDDGGSVRLAQLENPH